MRRFSPIPAALALVIVMAMAALLYCPEAFAQETQKAKAKWNFLIFLNGANNLYPYGPLTINQLKKIGSTDDVNIIILRGFMRKPSQKLLVKKGGVEVLETIERVDMGDYKELVKFVKWVHENYPAEHYILDIWNHGLGWKKKHGPATKGISTDDVTGNYITTAQLGEAMRAIRNVIGKNLDILAMDACNMQMAENIYELAGSVDYSVASEEIEPGTGWPYDKVAEPIVTNPRISPAQYAQAIVAVHKESYVNNKEEVTTISAVDISRFGAVFEKIEALSKELGARLGEPAVIAAVKKAAESVQKFDEGENIDLVHFCQLLNANIRDEKINRPADELINLVAAAPNRFVIANGTTGEAMKNAAGIAIYLPKAQIDPEYSKIIGFGKTSWAAFAAAYALTNPPAPPKPPAAAETPAAGEQNGGNE